MSWPTAPVAPTMAIDRTQAESPQSGLSSETTRLDRPASRYGWFAGSVPLIQYKFTTVRTDNASDVGARLAGAFGSET